MSAIPLIEHASEEKSTLHLKQRKNKLKRVNQNQRRERERELREIELTSISCPACFPRERES
jgi:hypothetical protein